MWFKQSSLSSFHWFQSLLLSSSYVSVSCQSSLLVTWKVLSKSSQQMSIITHVCGVYFCHLQNVLLLTGYFLQVVPVFSSFLNSHTCVIGFNSSLNCLSVYRRYCGYRQRISWQSAKVSWWSSETHSWPGGDMDCGSFVSVSVYWNVFMKHHTRIFLCHCLSHLHRTLQSSMCR